MPNNNISLNILQSCLEDQGFEIKLFYDRVKIYLSSAASKESIKEIEPDEDRQSIVPRALIHYDTMNLLVDALQPDTYYFNNLLNAIYGDYLISYVEFAFDILSNDKKQILLLGKLFKDLLVFERKRQKKGSSRFYHKRVKKTDYYGNRFDHKIILLVYTDRMNKLNMSKHCVHIELRLYGSKTIKEHGIYTIEDLIGYKNENIWNKYLKLQDVNLNQLGRLLSNDHGSMNNSSYWRQGKRIFDMYRSAQALLKDHPNCLGAFSPIKDRRMFQSRLNKALNTQ